MMKPLSIGKAIRVIAAAILASAMFASAASACTCSHHNEPPQNAEAMPLCHPQTANHTSHTADHEATSVEQDCICSLGEQPIADKASSVKLIQYSVAAAAVADIAEPQFIAIAETTAASAARLDGFAERPFDTRSQRGPPLP